MGLYKYIKYIFFYILYYLTTHGKPYEVGTETESSTLASSYTYRRGENIEKSKYSGGYEGKGGNLIKGERTLGDIDGGYSYSETF
jgi:hypothetical protein